jgi:hypothetical protein
MNILDLKRKLLPLNGFMSGSPASSSGTSTTGLPDWAKGYAQDTLAKQAALAARPYEAYGANRIQGFDPMQVQAQDQAANMKTSPLTGQAADIAGDIASKAKSASYSPSEFGSQFSAPNPYSASAFSNQFSAPDKYTSSNFDYNQVNSPTLTNYQMEGPADVFGQKTSAAQLQNAPEVSAAQLQGPERTSFERAEAERIQALPLRDLQMQAAGDISAERIGTNSFTQPGTADAYMSPYMQSVVDIQKREAARQSGIQGTQQQAQAAQAGAFGGSRDAIMRAERERNLAQQMGDIQATGSQAGFQNAQQQFNAEQAARLQAAQANQQTGLTAAQANQGVQQQAGLQNLSAGLQTQGLQAQTGLQAQQSNQQTGLQALLANQQAGMQTGQFNSQMGYNTNLQNAQLAQQAALSNQSLKGQYGLQQGQFNQAASMQDAQLAQQAALANQQAGLTVGQQNLAANLQTQQLGSGQSMQAQLANQQAGLTAQQAAEQSRQFGANQGMTGAQMAAQYGLAGQQAAEQSKQFGANQGMTSAQMAAQYGLAGQQAAEQSKQFGANYGMQGLQTGLTASGQLGGLGAQQFQQGMDVNQLQAAYGAQKQAMGQQGLNQAYQDYQNQREYPQQQLSNMANMMRGLPIGTTSTYTGTQNPGSPSFGQMLGSAGSAAWGLKQFFADGGSVDSQQNIESIVSKLSDQQLTQAEEAAKARGDQEQLQAIQMEKAARASMKNGLGALPVDMAQMLPTEQSMARGGIVAFEEGGGVSEDDEEDTNAPAQGPGNPVVYNEALQNQLAQAKAVADSKYKPMDPKEYNRIIEERRASLLKGIGESPYEGMRADAKRLGEESATNLKQGKGLAAIQAAAAMLQGNDLSRGLAAGASTFAGAYGEAVKADQAQKAATQRMNINIADAERKEKMGLTRDAITAADQARKDHQAAQQFGVDKAKALGKIYQGVATTSKPGAVKAPTSPKAAEIAIQSGVATRMAREQPKPGETPDMQRDRITSEESNRVLAMQQQRQIFSMADIGGASAALKGESQDTTKQTNASNAWDKASSKLKMSPDYLNAKPEVRTQMAEDAKVEVYSRFGLAPPKAAAPAKAAAAPAKTVPASQIPAGTTFGKAVPGKGTEVLKDGKVIGYAN